MKRGQIEPPEKTTFKKPNIIRVKKANIQKHLLEYFQRYETLLVKEPGNSNHISENLPPSKNPWLKHPQKY